MQNDKPKILMIISYFYPILAGAEVFAFELSKRLVESGYEVHVLTKNWNSEYNKKLKSFEEVEGIKIHRVPFLDLLFLRSVTVFPFMLLKGLSLMKKEKFDIIHSHVTYPNGMIGLFLKKIFNKPLIVTIQGDELFDYPEFSLLNLLKPLIIFTLKRANEIHSVSTALKNSIVKEGVRKNIITVIPNGVDLSKFKIIPKSIARRELNLPNVPLIVTTSRLCEKNGIFYLIQGFKDVLKEFPNAELLLIGEGPEREKLENYAKELGISKSIKFLGHIEHAKIPLYLSSSNVFIRPSLSEGFGISFIEAMVQKIPTIGTSVGGIVDIIENNENGLLIKPKSGVEVVESILQVLKNEAFAAKLSENGKKSVEEKFAMSKVTERMKEFYENLK